MDLGRSTLCLDSAHRLPPAWCALFYVRARMALSPQRTTPVRWREEAPWTGSVAGKRRGTMPPVQGPVSVPGVNARARPPAAEPGPDGRQPPAGSGPAPASATPAQLVDRAWRRWRAALDADPSDSALSDVDRLRDALLDLSAAHPSGIAQLFAGRPTRLSNLVREGAALSAAKRRVRAVADRADDYAQRYGLAPAFLAIGVATWTEPDEGPDPGDVEPDDEIGRAHV